MIGAGGLEIPRVAAIVVTMVGARSATKGVKDLASQIYIERAYRVAAKHSDLFDFEDPADAFVITDDFMSAGGISGALASQFRYSNSAIESESIPSGGWQSVAGQPIPASLQNRVGIFNLHFVK